MSNLTRRALAKAMAQAHSIPESLAYRLVGTLLDEMASALADGRRIELRDFGSFRVIQRKARKVAVPRQGTLQLPARPDVSFQPGKALAERLKKESPQ